MTKQEYINFSLNKGLKVKIDFNECTLSIANYKDCVRHGFLCLRPLSDLTKPIEHNGEKFVPIDNIEGLFVEGTEDLINQSIEAIEYFIENNFFSRMEYLPFILIQKLISWHFNLMDESEPFIDVNTLPENPYK